MMQSDKRNDWDKNFARLKEVELKESDKTEVYDQLLHSIEQPKGFIQSVNKLVPTVSVIVLLCIGGFIATLFYMENQNGKGTDTKKEYVFHEGEFPTLIKNELKIEKNEEFWYIQNKFGSSVGSFMVTNSTEEFARRKAIGAIHETKEMTNEHFDTLFLREHIKQPNLVQKLHYYFSYGDDHFHLQIHLGSIGSVMEQDAPLILEEFQNQILLQKETIDSGVNPSFQAILSSQLKGDNMYLAIVNDNRTNELQIPSEWEAYRLQIQEETKIIDENGNEISLNDVNLYEFYLNVWTKEPFISEWTKLAVNQQDRGYENHPLYTAKRIQVVEIPNEDYLERLYAKEEGKYALYIYIGEDLGGEIGIEIQKEINTLLHKEKNNMYIVSFISVPPDQEKQLFNIEHYPAYVILDHEKVLVNTVELEDILPYLNE
ncbi:hypothetical protein [Bacillus alkalisoli]|uniref:hypothetical protein n=1 Tax=Bacillus alkalisoli TaxID=2011008 RepID=UPI000C23C412|nr:hypothetical protein [Bacillus alkalisoli]